MDLLAARGVAFVRKDPMVDPEAEAELAALDIFSTPVTIIGGEVVVGFDRERLERLLDH